MAVLERNNWQGHFGSFLELGSQSMKLHRLENSPGIPEKALGIPSVHSRKFPWNLGPSILRQGMIGEAIGKQALETIIQAILEFGINAAPFPGYATGVFREAKNWGEFKEMVEKNTDISLNLLSQKEEARLLVLGIGSFLERPAVVIDVGGATTQAAHLPVQGEEILESFPFGAIRLRESHDGLLKKTEGYLQIQFHLTKQMDKVLGPFSGIRRLQGTGGTMKALARTLGNPFKVEDLPRLVREVQNGKFPNGLKKARKAVFLHGIVIVESIARILRAEEIGYPGPGVALGIAALLSKKVHALNANCKETSGLKI